MNGQKNIPRLWELTYKDIDKDIRLSVYADTLAYDCENGRRLLAAVRFGGYPEQVRAMADVIYGGGEVCMDYGDRLLFFQGLRKRYRQLFTNDGIYMEAVLVVENDLQQPSDGNEDNEKEKKQLWRTVYLYCDKDSGEQLFEQIDATVSVPLIPEFRDYVIAEMEQRNYLAKLEMVSSCAQFDVWKLLLSKDEQNIIEIVEHGLETGQISIPGECTEANAFEKVTSVSAYLNRFGRSIASKIQGQFTPLFDPSREQVSKEVLAVNAYIQEQAGYGLYDAQLAVSEAIMRSLRKNKTALCIAECGTGKTKIGITSLHAYQSQKGGRHFNIVLCPAHLPKKWLREIAETAPDSFAVQVKTVGELEKAYEMFQQRNQNCYVVITKEKARDGYMRRPAVTYNRRKHAFLCPDCGEPVMMDIYAEGIRYESEADQFFFQKENKKNHKCKNCGSPLWTVLETERQSRWVKIANYGLVYRTLVQEHLSLIAKKVMLKSARSKKAPVFPKEYYEIKAIADNPNIAVKPIGARPQCSLSMYISKKMRGKVDGLIIDELQDYNNNSGQGDAMNDLLGCAKRAVGLTGTLINGYSQGIFYLLYRVSPRLMQTDGKKYTATTDFNREYGVTETAYEVSDQGYHSNRRTAKRKLREKQLPGVSPLVYSRFLMNNAVFLSLNDMGKQLPEYEEIPVELRLPEEVWKEYKRIEDKFTDVMKYQRMIAQRVMSAFMSLLTVYPDQPYDMEPVLDPISETPLVQPKDTGTPDTLNAKDVWLLAKVTEKIARHERVVIYTSWVRIDTQERLEKLFREHGISACVLRSTVPTAKREEWIEKQVKNGVHVLITNPQLLETGLDLNDFTTLIYYNISYKLFTLRQSSRRSWRINQKAPRIEVYFLYFKGVMQHRAIRLMASKLAVAGVIEGNLTDEGLAAMSECQDLTTLLAQELTLGLKNETDGLDIGDVFKNMAFLKPEGEAAPETIEGEAELVETITEGIEEPAPEGVPAKAEAEPGRNSAAAGRTVVLDVSVQTVKRKRGARKKAPALENQLSLFDILDTISA